MPWARCLQIVVQGSAGFDCAVAVAFRAGAELFIVASKSKCTDCPVSSPHRAGFIAPQLEQLGENSPDRLGGVRCGSCEGIGGKGSIAMALRGLMRRSPDVQRYTAMSQRTSSFEERKYFGGWKLPSAAAHNNSSQFEPNRTLVILE